MGETPPAGLARRASRGPHPLSLWPRLSFSDNTPAGGCASVLGQRPRSSGNGKVAPRRSCPGWGFLVTPPPLGLTEAAPALVPASELSPTPSTPRELGVPPSRHTTARHPPRPGRAHLETLTRGPKRRPQLRLRFPLSRARPAPRAGASALALSTRSGISLRAAAGSPQTNSPSREDVARLSAAEDFFSGSPVSSELFQFGSYPSRAPIRHGEEGGEGRAALRALVRGRAAGTAPPGARRGSTEAVVSPCETRAGRRHAGASAGRGRDAAPAHPAPRRYPSLWSLVRRRCRMEDGGGEDSGRRV